MANAGEKEGAASPAKESMAEKGKYDAEVVSVELPAPAGWQKKFTPKKGGTPRRNEIVFISPTGEEITTKRQLEQYLRSHPGGHPSSEFDWGTGDTPRRSARISAKAKATETPEGEKPKKKERKSSSKKGPKDKKDTGDEDNEVPEAAEVKEPTDVEIKDAGDVAEEAKHEGASGEAVINEEKVEQESVNKAAENVEDEATEDVDKKVEEQGSTADPISSAPEAGNVMEKTEERKPDSETLPPTSEGNDDEMAEKEKPEDSETLPPPSEGKENEKAEKDKSEDSVVLPQSSEPPKEPAAEKEIKDGEKEIEEGDILAENDNRKDDREDAVPKEAHPLNCDDGQHQRKASPVNC